MNRHSIVLLALTFASVARAQPAPGDTDLERPDGEPAPAPEVTPPSPPPPQAAPPLAPPGAWSPPSTPDTEAPPLPTVPQPPTVAPPMKPICLEGTPHCSTTFLLEGGFRGGTVIVGVFDIGLLVTSGHDAFGATVGGMSFTDGMTSAGSGTFKARYRRYLGDDGFAFDLGAGVGQFGYSAEAAIGYRDIIALTAGAETLPQELNAQGGAGVGIRLGTEGLAVLAYVLATVASGH